MAMLHVDSVPKEYWECYAAAAYECGISPVIQYYYGIVTLSVASMYLRLGHICLSVTPN